MHSGLKASVASATAALMAIACSGVAQAQEPVRALWKSQEIDFNYQGFTTKYTCDGLRDRVREILLELGARRDLKAAATGCEFSGRPSPFPGVRLVIATPVEATPENIAKQTGAAEQFPASWRTVQLAQSGSKLRIQRGECELIEELRDHIFPKLGIRVIEDRTRCVPHQESLGQPNLTVAALVSVPQPDVAKVN